MTSARSILAISATLAVLAVLVPARSARAGLVGVRGGIYTKLNEPFVGVELLGPISRHAYFNPNVEYVFVDNHTYLTFNGDFHYDFHSHGRTFVWAGGGLAVVYDDPRGPAESSTDLGANFLFGIGFAGDAIPYIQGKLIVKDDTEFSLGVGLRF